MERAIKEGRNCFKQFRLPAHYTSIKDIFCLHEKRNVNGYNQIIWNTNKIIVPNVLPQGTEIELHVIPDRDHAEVRLWDKGKVIKVIHYKS